MRRREGTQPKQEKREQERREVVRIFLFQSRSEQSISDDENIKDISFTRLCLAKKGEGSNNPGQLMPVGGSIKEGESVIKAGSRESVMKAHLRPMKGSTVEFNTVQDYEFRHAEKKTTRKNRAHYVAGRLLPEPMDVPFSLEEGAKIESFVRLDPKQVRELFLTGKVNNIEGEEELLLQDGLSPDPQARRESSTIADDENISGVRNEVFANMNRIESLKKMNVLVQLMKRVYKKDPKNPPPFDRKQVILTARNLTSILYDADNSPEELNQAISEAEDLWRAHSEHFDHNDIRSALRYDNLRAKIGHAAEEFDIEAGKGVPTIDYILPLILENEVDFSDLRVLMQNPEAARIIRMVRIIQRAQETGVGMDCKDMIAKLEAKGLLQLETEVYDFNDEKELEKFPIDFCGMGKLVDDYFTEWQKVVGLERADFIDQLDEIKGADLPKLFAMATGNFDQVQVREGTDLKILRWEARRKIMCVLLLNDAIRIRNEIAKLGVAELDAIEKSLEVPMSYTERMSSGGKKRMKLNSAQTNNKRSILGGPINTYSDVSRSVRFKSLRSLVRKMMVRDKSIDVAQDAYAESYIFDTVRDKKRLQIKEFAVPMNNEENKRFVVRDNNGNQLEKFRAPQVVADLIATLLIAGRGQIEIEDYKPLPEEGKTNDGLNPGSGGKVRYAKFYIKHTDDKAEIRHREVHVYVPDNKTQLRGDEEYIRKYQDDKRYLIARLFDTDGLRSMMELLFPGEIYGEAVKKMSAKRNID